jgi:ribosomal protein S4
MRPIAFYYQYGMIIPLYALFNIYPMASNQSHMKKIAHLGGEATAKKFGGSEYFKMLANKRWKQHFQNTLNRKNVKSVLKQMQTLEGVTSAQKPER